MTPSLAVTIPELYCPFPSLIHPQVAALGQHALEWVRRFQLIQTKAAYQRFLDAEYWTLIARAYPTAPFDELALITEWNCWGFLLDDVDDDSPFSRQPQLLQQLFADILTIMRGEATTVLGGPLIEGLRDIWSRITALTTRAWRERFRATLGAGLMAYRWEAANRVNKVIPDRATYIQQRRQTGGWLTDVAMVDIIARIPDAAPLLAQPRVQAMLDAANNTICWANDLYSFGKEVERGDVHNLVIIVQHETGMSSQEAVEAVATLHDQEVRRFETLAMTLPRFGDERDRAAGAYASFCRAFMRGNIDWSRLSGRYAQIEKARPDAALSYIEPIVQQRSGGFFSKLFRRNARADLRAGGYP